MTSSGEESSNKYCYAHFSSKNLLETNKCVMLLNNISRPCHETTVIWNNANTTASRSAMMLMGNLAPDFRT